MLSSHLRDAALVVLIRIKITPRQLIPLTIQFLYIQSTNKFILPGSGLDTLFFSSIEDYSSFVAAFKIT